MWINLFWILHIAGNIVWVGGLLIVTLLMHRHIKMMKEAPDQGLHDALSNFEQRTMNYAVTPAAVVAFVAGVAYLWSLGFTSFSKWPFHGKLTFGVAMYVVHYFVYVKAKALSKQSLPLEINGPPIFMILHGTAGILLVVVLLFASGLQFGF